MTLLINVILFQCNWFRFSTELMTQVKTLQLQRKLKRERATSGTNILPANESYIKCEEPSSAIRNGKKND